MMLWGPGTHPEPHAGGPVPKHPARWLKASYGQHLPKRGLWGPGQRSQGRVSPHGDRRSSQHQDRPHCC